MHQSSINALNANNETCQKQNDGKIEAKKQNEITTHKIYVVKKLQFNRFHNWFSWIMRTHTFRFHRYFILSLSLWRFYVSTSGSAISFNKSILSNAFHSYRMIRNKNKINSNNNNNNNNGNVEQKKKRKINAKMKTYNQNQANQQQVRVQSQEPRKQFTRTRRKRKRRRRWRRKCA